MYWRTYKKSIVRPVLSDFSSCEDLESHDHFHDHFGIPHWIDISCRVNDPKVRQ